MNVILSPIGTRGDVQPMLVLGDELARRGHRVQVAGPPNFERMVATRGLSFLPIGVDFDQLAREERGLTEMRPLPAFRRRLQLLRQYVEQQVHDLLRTPGNVDLVVTAGLNYAGSILAEQRGAAYSHISYSSSTIRSAEHPPASIPLFGLPPAANRALWAAFLSLLDLTLGKMMMRLQRQYGTSTRDRPWRDRGKAALLAQDEIVGRLPSEARERYVQVPPLIENPERAQPLPERAERFIAGGSGAAKRPLVYIGFGSMTSLHRQRVVDAARELWTQHGVRVVLFSAYAEDDVFDLPEGVMPIAGLDHASLFPRMDLVVHHGGAGTLATALRAGVPQLIVPHIVDQFFHGRRVAALGLGPPFVPKAKFTAEAVVNALPALSNYRARAERVAATLDRSGGATLAADQLERLMGAHATNGRRAEHVSGASHG